MKYIILLFLIAGCTGNQYPVPDTGHKPYTLIAHDTIFEVYRFCGADTVSYGPLVNGKKGRLGACAFVDSSGCTIHMQKGAERLYLAHEQAHCDGTYNHDAIPFTQLWAHVTGNRSLIDGRVYIRGKLAE